MSSLSGAAVPLHPGRPLRVPGRRVARNLGRGQGLDLAAAGEGRQAAFVRRDGAGPPLGQVRRIAETPRHATKHQEVKSPIYFFFRVRDSERKLA